MERRKFLTGGGIVGLMAAVTGGQSLAKEEQIPRFENGALLTSEHLNRIVDELNRLKAK